MQRGDKSFLSSSFDNICTNFELRLPLPVAFQSFSLKVFPTKPILACERENAQRCTRQLFFRTTIIIFQVTAKKNFEAIFLQKLLRKKNLFLHFSAFLGSSDEHDRIQIRVKHWVKWNVLFCLKAFIRKGKNINSKLDLTYLSELIVSQSNSEADLFCISSSRSS